MTEVTHKMVTNTLTVPSSAIRTSEPTPPPNTIRSAFRRWKDKWRANSPSPSPSTRTYKPMDSAPSTRPPTNNSTAPPPPTSDPTSPIPLSTALFAPTTCTTIHSPADPRNRSTSPSPANTLRKRRPSVSRRNTIQNDPTTASSTSPPRPQAQPHSHSHPHMHHHHQHQPPLPYEDFSNLPLGQVTTTIVANNASDPSRRKRQSRLRLSFSKRGSAISSPLGSPSFPRLTERSSSPSLQRLHERSSSRARAAWDDRLGSLEETKGRRVRADSYREGFGGEEGGTVRLVKEERSRERGVSGRSTPIYGLRE